MPAISITPHKAKQHRSMAQQQPPRIVHAEYFTEYFGLALATDPHAQEQTFKIRGDVYCKEFQYEPEERCPNGLEQDEHDDKSLHAIIIHRDRQLPAGCVRLVLPNDYDQYQLLPLEESCIESLTHATIRPSLLPRSSQIEISRLAVHTLFRRRTGEKAAPDGMAEMVPFADIERRAFPLIGNVLSLASISLANLIGREHIFVMMEPRLARLLKHLGLDFLRIGEVIDYHGKRAAFYINTEQAVANIKPEYRELYDFTEKTLWHDLCGSDQLAIA